MCEISAYAGEILVATLITHTMAYLPAVPRRLGDVACGLRSAAFCLSMRRRCFSASSSLECLEKSPEYEKTAPGIPGEPSSRFRGDDPDTPGVLGVVAILASPCSKNQGSDASAKITNSKYSLLFLLA